MTDSKLPDSPEGSGIKLSGHMTEINRLERQRRIQDQPVVRVPKIPEIAFYPGTQTVTWNEEIVTLTPRQFKFVMMVASRPQIFFSITRIQEKLGTPHEKERRQNTAEILTTQSTRAFRMVDKTFDRLRFRRSIGVAWEVPDAN